MPAMTGVPNDDPLMIAWEKYSTCSDYANSLKWAAHDEHRQGSMWAVFMAGWEAAKMDARDRPE